MEATFLIITDQVKSLWFQKLVKVLATLGEAEARSEQEVMQFTIRHMYDVIIVDAATVDNVQLVIARLLAQQPESRVVVVTGLPTWRRTKEALQAGAMDYINKSLSDRELLSVFKEVLSKAPPRMR